MNKMNYSQKTIDRFASKVQLPQNLINDCWLWIGGVKDKNRNNNRIYGAFRLSSYESIASHRFSYEYYYGPIPQGLLVCHKCDNPLCINPYHLFLGTVQDNNLDKLNKGRQSSILTKEIVIEILDKINNNILLNYTQISSQYGVCESNINSILCGNHWKHVTKNYNLEELKNKLKYSTRKLNDEKVKEIKLRIKNGERQQDIADNYNIARQTVSDIKLGKRWKHITI